LFGTIIITTRRFNQPPLPFIRHGTFFMNQTHLRNRKEEAARQIGMEREALSKTFSW
jgi:hypothetical protein